MKHTTFKLICTSLFTAFTTLFASMASNAAEPINLGVAGAHSGDLASYGIPSVKAAELVVKHKNSMNGVNGRKIVLLVEDDENLGTLLREYLIVKSYEVDWFVNGEKAYKSFIKGHYDLCIQLLVVLVDRRQFRDPVHG